MDQTMNRMDGSNGSNDGSNGWIERMDRTMDRTDGSNGWIERMDRTIDRTMDRINGRIKRSTNGLFGRFGLIEKGGLLGGGCSLNRWVGG